MDDAMDVEVEVVSEILRYVLGDGTNEYEDEIINDSVGMEGATQSDNGDGGVVNDMDLEENGAARRSLPITRLRGSAVDSDEDYVEDMEMKAEVVEEEDFDEDEKPLKGLRNAPYVLNCCPLNDSLVSFLIIMLTNELCPLMLCHHCFRWLISLRFPPWSITSL